LEDTVRREFARLKAKQAQLLGDAPVVNLPKLGTGGSGSGAANGATRHVRGVRTTHAHPEAHRSKL
jgi:hypothetical protein